MAAPRKLHLYTPTRPVAPGETLRETIDHLKMSQRELAQRLGLTPVSVNRILQGEQPITQETAGGLERVTGVPARFWNNLERQYRELLEKQAQRERAKAETSWLLDFPHKVLVKRGYLPDTKDEAELVNASLRFFGFASVDQHREHWQHRAAAARRSQSFESDPGAAAAWIRMGELEAAKIQTEPYNAKAFRAAVLWTRGQTRRPWSESLPAVRAACAAAGVAFCVVEGVARAPWSGATVWLAPDKAMVLLSLRHKTDERFWFSFFHEAAHVLQDSKKEIHLNDGEDDDPCEVKANRWAEDTLIPADRLREVATLASEADAQRIADELGIAPGIVVGRHQFLTKRFNRFNKLKRKITASDLA